MKGLKYKYILFFALAYGKHRWSGWVVAGVDMECIYPPVSETLPVFVVLLNLKWLSATHIRRTLNHKGLCLCCHAQFMLGSNYTIFLSFEIVIISFADHRFIHFCSFHLTAPTNIDLCKHSFYESQWAWTFSLSLDFVFFLPSWYDTLYIFCSWHPVSVYFCSYLADIV